MTWVTYVHCIHEPRERTGIGINPTRKVGRRLLKKECCGRELTCFVFWLCLNTSGKRLDVSEFNRERFVYLFIVQTFIGLRAHVLLSLT